MNAMQPWAGSYGAFGPSAPGSASGSGTNGGSTDSATWSAGPMIWASAHTMQFTDASGAWSYLAVGPGGGSGLLLGGGSYVALKNFATGDVTIVVEKLSAASACLQPGTPGPSYGALPERATLMLQGGLAGITSLHVWRTHWAFGPNDTTEEFVYAGSLPVVAGAVTLDVAMDSVYTLTTVAGGSKGAYAVPPQPSLFPTAWEDDFEGCVPPAEPDYVCDMSGAMECAPADPTDPPRGTILAMRTPLIPVPSGGDLLPHSLLGALDTVNASLAVDARIQPGGGALLLGVRVQQQEYDPGNPNPIVGALLAVEASDGPAGSYSLWPSAAAVVGRGGAPLATGPAPVRAGEWHSYRLDANGTTVSCWLDGAPLFSFDDSAAALPPNGHALLGAPGWGNESGLPQFDNLGLFAAYSACGAGSAPPTAGAPAAIVQCSSEAGMAPGSVWIFSGAAYPPAPTPGRHSLVLAPGLCLAAPNATAGSVAVLAACNASDASQEWEFTFVNMW